MKNEREFCCWLKGYLEGCPLGLSASQTKEVKHYLFLLFAEDAYLEPKAEHKITLKDVLAHEEKVRLSVEQINRDAAVDKAEKEWE